MVELAGLEPATSWVRLRGKPSPPFAMLRTCTSQAVLDAGAFTHRLPSFVAAFLTKLDQHAKARFRKPLLYPPNSGGAAQR